MTIIGFTTLALTLLTAFALGIKIEKSSQRTAVFVSAISCFFILLKALFQHFPALEFALFPFEWYSYIQPWWAFPFALLLFGIGTAHVSNRGEKFGLALLSGTLFFSVIYIGWAVLQLDAAKLTGVPDKSGVVFQTAKFSCGAAAAATLLAQTGIESSEREMAELCGTNFVTGTGEIAVVFGLRKKLKGLKQKVSIIQADWSELQHLHKPAMANIRLSFILDHWIVVLSVTKEAVKVADPINGIRVISREQFLEQWLGVLIFVY